MSEARLDWAVPVRESVVDSVVLSSGTPSTMKSG
jgi:hypothetical protein